MTNQYQFLSEHTTLSIMIEFMSKHVDESMTFTRKSLITHVNYSKPLISNSTIDNYRNYLCKAGFLESIAIGHFKIMKTVPTDMTVNLLMSLAYPEKNNI